jgi:hypothetical protein
VSAYALEACRTCGSGNAPGAPRCWVCGAVPGEGPLPRAPVSSSSTTSATLAWVVVVLGILFVTLLIGISLAFEWPGLLIPYAIVVVMGLTGVATVVFAVVMASRAMAPSRGGAPVQPRGATAKSARDHDAVTDLAQAVGIVAIVVAIALVVFFLLFVAAIIVFFLVCFAMIAAA